KGIGIALAGRGPAQAHAAGLGRTVKRGERYRERRQTEGVGVVGHKSLVAAAAEGNLEGFDASEVAGRKVKGRKIGGPQAQRARRFHEARQQAHHRLRSLVEIDAPVTHHRHVGKYYAQRLAYGVAIGIQKLILVAVGIGRGNLGNEHVGHAIAEGPLVDLDGEAQRAGGQLVVDAGGVALAFHRESQQLVRVVGQGGVKQGTDTLAYAWAGGLNAPQFSTIDLNYDGQPDLYAFDRESRRSYTFLNVAAATGTGRRWQYAPQYEGPQRRRPPRHYELRLCGLDGDAVPNQVDNSADRLSMRHSVRQYRNTSAATAVPSYAQVSDGFLQNDMLDVSEGAAPTFGDIDGDGLADMLVGNQGDYVNSYYRASLAYYRNVGTAHRPVFRLISDDYLGLAATAALTPTVHFESLRPALVDLNHDGALDLAYSVYTSSGGQLRFILNTAAAGQPVSFNPAQSDYFRPQGTGAIATTAGDTPCFFDMDGDG
nr:hypothetical protein [Tanacetum cinerariifolium]